MRFVSKTLWCNILSVYHMLRVSYFNRKSCTMIIISYDTRCFWHPVQGMTPYRGWTMTLWPFPPGQEPWQSPTRKWNMTISNRGKTKTIPSHEQKQPPTQNPLSTKAPTHPRTSKTKTKNLAVAAACVVHWAQKRHQGMTKKHPLPV